MASAHYIFLPWLRKGLARFIASPSQGNRASLDVQFNVSGNTGPSITKEVFLKGPGDVLGINPKTIVRTEPLNNITDFESNHLAAIEFFDEDFPWRFSTGAVQNNRLIPWVTLMVLKYQSDEYEEESQGTRPLSVIKLKAPRKNVLPPVADLWAWSHVQINDAISIINKKPNIQSLNDTLNNASEKGVSRVLCPRHLEANTAYTAFLIPTFENGRKAGLGEPVSDQGQGDSIAWSDSETEAKLFPYYYTWFFRTGAGGDFESLARLLKPKEVDKRIGIRDLSIQSPGFNIQVINNTIVGLEGALLSPFTKRNPENSIHTASDFPAKLIPIINKPAEQLNTATNEDPIISPPLYGQWHAAINRLSLAPNDQNWFHELNQDPRYRVAAGMGTQVVQKDQETWMRTAWNQVGKIIEANQKIRLAQLSMITSEKLVEKHFKTLPPERSIFITGKVADKIVFNGKSLGAYLRKSIFTHTITTGSFRKILRSKDQWTKRTRLSFNGDSVLRQLNTSTYFSRSIKQPVPLSHTLPESFSKELDLSKNALDRISSRKADVVIEWKRTNLAGRNIPGKINTIDASVFKKAINEFNGLLRNKSVPAAIPYLINTKSIADTLAEELNPRLNFPIYIKNKIPAATSKQPDEINTIMAYPDIDQAMYQSLVQIDKEYFVPNLHLLSPNSISIMTPNNRFIESYMVGLNHEMMRELLWREYPTDQRGSPFRQFWTPVTTQKNRLRGFKENAELNKDIKPVHTWLSSPSSKALGTHNNKNNNTDPSPKVVLAIKGDLLKRYPNTIIFAKKAVWHTDPNDIRLVINQFGDTMLEDEDTKLPIYKAQVSPDIHFIGFDLHLSEAKGDVKDETKEEKQRLGNTKLGWFFIFQQVPGETRFGLDDEMTLSGDGTMWENLSWANMELESEMISLSKPLNSLPAGPNPDQVQWNSNAADQAYILYQKPVMVAFHAREMLRELKTNSI